MKQRSFIAVLAIMTFVALSTSARAVQPDEMLADPVLEAKAREISAELRCLVCQNQNIDDSDAALARDLRLIVRERLEAGDSKEQVIDYAVARYGEFILLRPRFTAKTALLWFAPLLLLAGGALLAYRAIRPAPGKAATDAPPPLTEAEKARLAAIMDKDGA
jgi:cytochrome c-type biogenesis protein CcmH